MLTPINYINAGKWLMTIGVFFANSFSCNAQATEQQVQTYSFNAVSSGQGLPHYSTHHIMQDSFGFIWISTRDGLCRFDGRSCTVFRANKKNGLKLDANLIWLTFEDSKKRLWVGTKGGGLSYFNPETGTSKVFKNEDGNPQTLSKDIVTAIFEDSNNTLWVGTDGGGLNKVIEHSNEDSIYFEPIKLRESTDDNLAVLDIEESEAGKLWIATYGHGILTYDLETGVIDSINTKTRPIQLKDNYVMTLAQEDSTMWVGTKFGGLSSINIKGASVQNFSSEPDHAGSLPNNFIWNIYIDDQGNKWIGTYGGGLAFLEKGRTDFRLIKDANTQNGFSDKFILHTMQDKQGQLWIATDSQGAFRFRTNSVYRQLNMEWTGIENTSNLIINHLFLDSGNKFWISTNSGLFTADQDFKNIQKKESGLGTSIFYEVNEDEAGRIWIASNNDLGYYNPKTGLWGDLDLAGRLNEPGTDRYFDIEFGKNGWIWLATDGGLVAYHPDTKEVELYQHKESDPETIAGNKISSILVDDHFIWVGTDDLGMSLFNTKTKTAEHIDLTKFITKQSVSEYITDITKDTFGNIAVGTADKGLYYIYHTDGVIDSVQHINKKNTLQASSVFDIQPVEDYLLVSYREGMSKLNIHSSSIINTKLPEAISISGTKELYEAKGNLYFFSRDKIFNIESQHIRETAASPAVQLTGLEVYNKPVASAIALHNQNRLELGYDEDFITITYSTLNYDINASYSTEYILEGHDPFWLEGAESESINYSNLQPGEYVFKVRFTDDEGNRENQLELPVIVRTPFWQTNFFYFILLFSILTVLYLAFKYRMYYLLKEEKTRTQIARDLHDDLSGTLSSISFFSEAARRVQSKPEEAKRFLLKIDSSAAEAKEKINDIIWAIDPSKDNWSVFLKKCTRYATDALDSKGIEYAIDIDDSFKMNIGLELRQNLWLIYKEMINNLAEHSNATKAEIIFTEKDKEIHLRVEDNGKGFDKNKENTRNGITNIIQRSKLIGGIVELKSAPGEGTRWNLTVKR